MRAIDDGDRMHGAGQYEGLNPAVADINTFSPDRNFDDRLFSTVLPFETGMWVTAAIGAAAVADDPFGGSGCDYDAW